MRTQKKNTTAPEVSGTASKTGILLETQTGQLQLTWTEVTLAIRVLTDLNDWREGTNNE